ncbi:hypothetical protein [Microscilla marina]|uniref:Uncharacterized protein n=1 Tax=Microscilla marina ATCC 23134 TaxID=313606 RepID=A1ZCB9_MICM2|nr:hypothetical protein [Microscilla marina]EAY31921.1 hypothetical protein M23134_01950 [Microscilla marina ATCC 23134]
MQKQSPIHQLIDLFQEAFVRLHLDIPPKICEKYAVFIYSCMDNGKRKFHTTEHVLNVCHDMAPLQILAGLFHDVVYYQVDKCFLPQFEDLVLQVVTVNEQGVHLKNDLSEDYLIDLCLDLFNFAPGQLLKPDAGLNEFLSAWVAVSYLKDFLKAKDLMTIVACIEATIPFRPKDDQGMNCFDHLELRIQHCFPKYQLSLALSDIEQMVRLAAGLANRDVENFADKDIGRFLDNTWALLPETNDMLWRPGVYYNQDYRVALSKMEGFLSCLDPQNIFHHYKGAPDEQYLVLLKQQAHHNLQTSEEYLQVKILAITIVEALAKVTGGDAPVSLFLGDGIIDGVEKAEDYLPPIELSDHLAYNDTIYRLLEYGRTSDTSFDIKNSPIGAFTYKLLGDKETKKSMDIARQMFLGSIAPETFLRLVNRDLVSHIAQACAILVTTRKKELVRWL